MEETEILFLHWQQSVLYNIMQHNHKPYNIFSMMCDLLFLEWKVLLSCCCHCSRDSTLICLWDLDMGATFVSSCLGVVERHLGKCRIITEFEGDEACWGKQQNGNSQPFTITHMKPMSAHIIPADTLCPFRMHRFVVVRLVWPIKKKQPSAAAVMVF